MRYPTPLFPIIVAKMIGGGGGGSGLTQAQFESIAALFRLAVYDGDPSEAYAAFVAAFSNFDIYQNGSVLTINGGVSVSQVSDTLTLS